MWINRWAPLTALLAFAACANAQNISSSILGTLVDPSGAAVPAATVRLTNTDTNMVLTVQTNADGIFRFPTLLAGRYSLAVEAGGFKGYRQSGH